MLNIFDHFAYTQHGNIEGMKIRVQQFAHIIRLIKLLYTLGIWVYIPLLVSPEYTAIETMDRFSSFMSMEVY